MIMKDGMNIEDGMLRLSWTQKIAAHMNTEGGMFLDSRTRKMESSETHEHRRRKVQELSSTPYQLNISSDDVIVVLPSLVRWGSFVNYINIICFKIVWFRNSNLLLR
jgi:hypothetical protein